MRSIVMITVAVFVSFIIYPMLHETGHMIGASIAGANIKELTVLSQPAVVCSFENRETCIFVGCAGTVFPTVVALSYSPKSFVLWYANFILRAVIMFTGMVSMASVFAFFQTAPVKNDDVTVMLSIAPEKSGQVLLIVFLCTVFTAQSCFKENILKRCYFYIENTQS